MPTQLRCVLSEALTVSFGIGIAGLDTQSECAKHCFGVLQFVGKILELEQGFDPGKEFFGEDRLIEKVVRAGFNAAYTVLAVGETRDHDYGDEARYRIILQL